MHIIPLLVIIRESNDLNFMKLRNGKVQDKKFKDFKAKIWSFYQNISQKMGKRNYFQMILDFLSNC